MAASTTGVSQPLEPIDYLSRSANRVEVLGVLTETIRKPGLETPGYEPRELREETGASIGTVSRILNEFQERGWAERDAEGEYTATPRGQSIAIEFTPLIDAMGAIQHLGDAVALLPLNELTISLKHFSDATVRKPQGPGSRGFYLFLSELLAESATWYTLSFQLPSERFMDKLTEQITTGNLDYVGINRGSVLEFLSENNTEQVRAQHESGIRVYRYDGHFPCCMFIFDETVVIENSQVDGIRNGTVIVSEDAVVREWALKVFERYREDSTEFTIEDLPE